MKRLKIIWLNPGIKKRRLLADPPIIVFEEYNSFANVECHGAFVKIKAQLRLHDIAFEVYLELTQ